MGSQYERIVADIRRRIEGGELAAGDRVPSTRSLVAEYGVAMATATKALTALRQAGLVRALPGVGTVVAAGTPPRRAATGAGGSTRDRLVREAVALADAEGMAGLSMRRVAAGAGVATMSVYRYVANRDELVVLMADAVIGERPLPEPSGDWRARLETCARLIWAACRAHPWLAAALSMTRPQALPHGMAYTEWLLAAVDGYGLDLEARMHVAVTLLTYVRGVAVGIEPEADARQDSGLTDEEWIQTQKPTFEGLADPVAFPHLSRAIRTELDITLDSLFEFGLARFLDGLAVLLGEPGRPGAPGSVGQQ